MCLTKVIAEYDAPIYKIMTVWKVFDKIDGRLEPVYRKSSGERYQAGQWYRASVITHVVGSDGRWYPSGFHCFMTRRDARSYHKLKEGLLRGHCIRKVRVREIVTQGLDDNSPVVVAREMFILPLKRRKR